MKEYNKEYLFRDNSQKRDKLRLTVVVHWTGGHSAAGAIEHLDHRRNGKGSVGYNVIIEKNGDIFILAEPKTRWMHNTGLGTSYDKKTISISFVALNAKDKITSLQIESFRDYIEEVEDWCDIAEITCHRELNRNKPDFPRSIWEELYKRLI